MTSHTLETVENGADQALPPYRHTTTTRGHGLAILLISGLVMAMGVFALWVFWSGESPHKEKILSLLLAGPLCLGAAWGLFLAVSHILRPHEAWIQIDGEAVSWRDWLGPNSMQEWRYPLSQVRKMLHPSEASECLVLWDGTAVSLPTMVIPNMDEFRKALKARAPHIVAEAWDGKVIE